MSYVNRFLLVAGLIVLTACGDISDDLNPSDNDQREDVVAGSIGNMPGQMVADFTIKDSLGNDFILSEFLAGGATPADVIVLYFTMWCPICLSHSDHLNNFIIPQFENRGTVIYGLVDYVSGSVSITRASEQANGFVNSDFITLADENQLLFNQLNAAMGTVVVIDNDGTILLNEDYRTGTALADILGQQLP
ncbi:MAG: redoxin domain-containing protein [Gammaproteobacteria bacterium]|nr:redoxin domain-containing protein [Gammaproteobacteria bacterium]